MPATPTESCEQRPTPSGLPAGPAAGPTSRAAAASALACQDTTRSSWDRSRPRVLSTARSRRRRRTPVSSTWARVPTASRARTAPRIERGVPHSGVVLDVAGPLVGGHQAQAPRAPGAGDGRLTWAAARPQIGARPVPQEEEVVAGRGGAAERGFGWDSTEAGTTAPVPRSVALPPPTLKSAKTAEPTTRIGDVRAVRADLDLLPEVQAQRAQGARAEGDLAGPGWGPAREQGQEPVPAQLVEADRGHHRAAAAAGAATLTCP